MRLFSIRRVDEKENAAQSLPHKHTQTRTHSREGRAHTHTLTRVAVYTKNLHTVLYSLYFELNLELNVLFVSLLLFFHTLILIHLVWSLFFVCYMGNIHRGERHSLCAAKTSAAIHKFLSFLFAASASALLLLLCSARRAPPPTQRSWENNKKSTRRARRPYATILWKRMSVNSYRYFDVNGKCRERERERANDKRLLLRTIIDKYMCCAYELVHKWTAFWYESGKC